MPFPQEGKSTEPTEVLSIRIPLQWPMTDKDCKNPQPFLLATGWSLILGVAGMSAGRRAEGFSKVSHYPTNWETALKGRIYNCLI